MSFKAQQSRVDALVRMLALVILAFGLLLIYYTHANANVAGVASEIVTINYALGVLLTAVGLFGALSKFK